MLIMWSLSSREVPKNASDSDSKVVVTQMFLFSPGKIGEMIQFDKRAYVVKWLGSTTT